MHTAIEKNPMTGPSGRLYLLYHELRPSQTDYSYVVDTTDFANQIELFRNLREKSAQGLRPEITFDDGHISNFEFALPILQSNAIRAWFFITVGWTGQKPGYMDWPELRALHQAGQIIGAHGWTHTLLTHCNAKELHRELNEARLTLEDKLGAPVTTMSLPGGRYNRNVLAACQEAGYTQVFTSIPRTEPDADASTIGRLNIRGDMTLDWLSKLFDPASPLLPGLQKQYRRKAAAKSILGDRLYEKLWAILNRQESDTEPGAPGT
jgi:peptidoglycan/xylan/chitin deacetylase (PgdA/CDA1 family)